MFRLPFLFITTGLAGFALYALSTMAQAAEWIAQPPRIPAGWFHAHLFVLGWATMIAMGAVYQLINVVLQKDLYSRKLGYVHYALYTVGTAGLLTGFAAGRAEWIAVSAALALTGMFLFAANIGVTLIRAAQWNPITISTAAALLYLVLTGLAGLLMGLNFALRLWPDWHERLLFTHMWLGTVGWFGLLITGFSHKMLPMFYLAHGVSNRLAYAVCWLWNAAVLAGAAVFLTGANLPAVGAAVGLLTLAVYAYNVHTTQIRKARHKKSPGAGVLAAVWSTRALAVVCTAALAYILSASDQGVDERWVVVFGWAYLWGWVALNILGYLSKIVPFLWWTHKYGPRVGKEKIPAMADLLEDRWVAYGLALIAGSLAMLIVGLGLDHEVWIRWSGAALSLFSLLYACLIGWVFAR